MYFLGDIIFKFNENNNLYSDQQIKVVEIQDMMNIFNPETFEKSIKLLIATSFGIANPNYLNKKKIKSFFKCKYVPELFTLF